MNTGERLKKLRKERGVSAYELANTFDCSRQYIHSLERSANPLSRAMLEKYCEYFNTSADFIMGMNEQKSVPVIPVFLIDENQLKENSSMSIPSSFLKKDREYFAVSIADTQLVVLEKDGDVQFEKKGMFRYDGRYYFSRLEQYSDGSIWLISEGKKRPEQVKEISKLTSLGYQSYQLA